MKRLNLWLKSLEPPVAVARYKRAAAGELLHIDTKAASMVSATASPETARRNTTAVSAGTGQPAGGQHSLLSDTRSVHSE